jgi:ubiquitin carboxyl-terminal hydrolase 7
VSYCHIDWTFCCVKLEDGDILCYQKALTREEEESYRYPDVPSFLEYIRNRQVIVFSVMLE